MLDIMRKLKNKTKPTRKNKTERKSQLIESQSGQVSVLAISAPLRYSWRATPIILILSGVTDSLKLPGVSLQEKWTFEFQEALETLSERGGGEAPHLTWALLLHIVHLWLKEGKLGGYQSLILLLTPKG